MKAEEVRKIADQYIPDITDVIHIVKKEAKRGKYKTRKASKQLFNPDVREYLKQLGYKLDFVDVHEYEDVIEKWEISWEA
jgi:hypothetical protein